MISIMSRNKTGKTIIQKGLLIVFYLVLWQFVSEVIGNSLLLPSPVEVFRSLFCNAGSDIDRMPVSNLRE